MTAVPCPSVFCARKWVRNAIHHCLLQCLYLAIFTSGLCNNVAETETLLASQLSLTFY